MIVANLATYPPRLDGLINVVRRIAPQVDRLNVVLNEYDDVPPALRGIAGVFPILPQENTMDVGKFLPEVGPDDRVFLIDDDIHYPPDFVATSLAKFDSLGRGRWLAGYHASTYELPKIRPSLRAIRRYLRYAPGQIADYRKIEIYSRGLARAVVVDQVATNAALMMGRDLPPYDFMRDSRKFVDVRLARWCYEQGITPVALPRMAKWLTGERFEETIHQSFTLTHPPHVAKEIWTYAFKVPRRGRSPARLRKAGDDEKA